MKEASGELNMTLITIIAIGVILVIFYAFKDQIANAIDNIWKDQENSYQEQTYLEDNTVYNDYF